jgi:hypothetical protein
MFFPGSRYETASIVTVTRADGTLVRAVRPPRREQPESSTLHRRSDGQRLDHIAAHYLDDAAAFWRLCDAAGAMSPDALSVHDTIPIPAGEE